MPRAMGPDEFMRALEEATDRRRMEAEDWRLRWEDFIASQTDENLATFRRILSDVSSDDTGKYASYLEGYVASMMVHTRKICPSCGAHDHLLHDVEAILSAGKNKTPAPEGEPPSEYSDEEYIATLAKYRVHLVKGSFDGEWGAVECDECSIQYPSLQARALRKSCSGCGLKPAE